MYISSKRQGKDDRIFFIMSRSIAQKVLRFGTYYGGYVQSDCSYKYRATGITAFVFFLDSLSKILPYLLASHYQSTISLSRLHNSRYSAKDEFLGHGRTR